MPHELRVANYIVGAGALGFCSAIYMKNPNPFLQFWMLLLAARFGAAYGSLCREKY